MSLKFASNLSFMFLETSAIIERYQLAKNAGFKAVESGFPYGFSIKQVEEAKKNANIDQILINIYTGDVKKGELGFAAIPGKEDEFKLSVETTIEYAKALNCKMIHVMAGKVESVTQANDDAYENNLLYAVKRFEQEGITGVIEPINPITVPNYYLHSYEKGLNIIKKINSPNLKLLLDIFHLQHIQGNIKNSIKKFMPYIGHVQIAQVPDRHEPDSPGEINYAYILELLKAEGYRGYVGLEYTPASSTAKGLDWVNKLGYTL